MGKVPVRILIDCDGVLTDGRLTIDHTGRKLFKSFHTRDVRAIRELVAAGYEVTIVTADDWAGGKSFAEKVGADWYCARSKPVGSGPYIAVGDDAWDVRMLEAAETAFCPADADASVLELSDVVRLETEGGRGVMAEVARRLLS